MNEQAENTTSQRELIIEALKTVMDPEIYIDIWTLGLIYDIDVVGTEVSIRMTFTSIACPVGPMLVEEVRQKTANVPGVTKVNVEVTFTPPWEPSDDLKAMMGLL